MKLKLLIVILINTMICFGQTYVVEEVHLTETLENEYVSKIPKLKDLSNADNPVVERINFQILDRFMINSYEQSEIDDFRWFDIEFSSQIDADILYISFSGEYIGAYPNGITDEMFFDLKSGEALKYTVIPFQALFTLSGYLDFLNKYWLEGVKKEFATAIECAGFEPYCNYFDITSYRLEGQNLSISMTEDCYPHVALGCSPVYSLSVKLDSLKHYLGPVGKYLLIESNYMNLSPIEKFLKNEKVMEKVPDNTFLFGKINDKYLFSMAINMDNAEQVTGYYYYNSKLQKINLKGKISENKLFLTETVNNKQTGFFELDINIDNQPIFGKWLNTEKTKSLDVQFTHILTCKTINNY